MKREKETLPTVCPERYCKTIGHGMRRKELTGWVTFADILQKCLRLHFHLLTVYSVVNEKKLPQNFVAVFRNPLSGRGRTSGKLRTGF